MGVHVAEADDGDRDGVSPERRAALQAALIEVRGRVLGRPLSEEEMAELDARVAAQPALSSRRGPGR